MSAVCAAVALTVGPATAGTGDGEKNLCRNGGWQTVYQADGTSFKNEDKCLAYLRAGGRLLTSLTADISLSYDDAVGPKQSKSDQSKLPRLIVTNGGPLPAQVTIAVFRACGDRYGANDGLARTLTDDYTIYKTLQPLPAGKSLTARVAFHCDTYAEVTASSLPDPDSTPNNGVTTEDDYVVIPETNFCAPSRAPSSIDC